MAKDILFTVGLDFQGLDGQMAVLRQAIHEVAGQVNAAAADFSKLEAEAVRLGTTVQDLGGLSNQTAEAFRDFEATSRRMENNFRSLRMNALAPLVRELDEVARAANNAATELFDQGSTKGYEKLLLKSVTPLAHLSVDKKVHRLSDAEIKARQVRRSGEDLARQKQIAAGQATVNDRFDTRMMDAQDRFLSQMERRQGNQGLRRQMTGIDNDLFDELQQIQRNAFHERQRILAETSGGGMSIQQIRRNEQRARELFDLSQRTQTQSHEARERSDAHKAMVRNEHNTKEAVQKLDQIMLELQAQREKELEQVELDVQERI